MKKQLIEYRVIHPLDDIPEQKVDISALGAMKLTISVKWSLFALRAYLILVVVLVFFHVYTLAMENKVKHSEVCKRPSFSLVERTKDHWDLYSIVEWCANCGTIRRYEEYDGRVANERYYLPTQLKEQNDNPRTI